MMRKKPTHEDVFKKYGEMLRTPGLSEQELRARNEEMFKMLVDVGDPNPKPRARIGRYVFYGIVILVVIWTALATGVI